MYYNHKLYQEDLVITSNSNLAWDKLKNKRILITGATGLIGCFLIDLFMYRNHNYGNNIKLCAIGRNEALARERFASYWDEDTFTFVQHDVNNVITNVEDIDFILHAASNTHPVAYASDPIGTITTNIIGTYNVLQYAVEHKVDRFVFLSTVEIYGENRGDIEKFSETDCGYIDCNTLRAGYPESKRAGEALCNAYAQKHGVDIVIPRLCRIYGPTMLDTDSKAVAQFIKNSVAGENIILKSKGNQIFSYCYVADAVSAILTVMLNGQSGEAYNISDDKSNVSLKDLAGFIASISGTKVLFQLPGEIEQKGFSKATKAVLDSTKLKKLGWIPIYDISIGLWRTINIIKNL